MIKALTEPHGRSHVPYRDSQVNASAGRLLGRELQDDDDGTYVPPTTFRLPACPYETDTFLLISGHEYHPPWRRIPNPSPR